MNDEEQTLLDDAQQIYPSHMRAQARTDGDGWVADPIEADGTVVWPVFAHGPSALLAVLAAEQRYPVEQDGEGSLPGGSYIEKAEARFGCWLAE